MLSEEPAAYLKKARQNLAVAEAPRTAQHAAL